MIGFGATASVILLGLLRQEAAVADRQLPDREGIVFLRTTREKTPVLYRPGELFPIGGSRVVRSSEGDRVTLVAAGITLHEALAAAETLAGDGIAARVIDLYSVKPINAATLRQAARETGQIVTIEDHWPEGGIGDAVLEVFGPMSSDHPRVTKLAVRGMPGSATPAQQLAEAGIDADAIIQTVRELVGAPAGASAQEVHA